MSIQLVVGLGNPGDAYVDTRHNIGFKFIHALLRCTGGDQQKKATLKSHVYQIMHNGARILAIKPQTYMNLSGDAVVAVMNYYKLTPNNICVVTDDLDIPFGRVRLRLKGGAGTHNGMKSIIQQLNTHDFIRLRLGIGPKPEFMDAKDVVLQRFNATEQQALPGMLERVAKGVMTHITDPVDVMMNRLNPVDFLL
ncbi:MAG: aminoacyl-tRNA hydrolase [Candidatus Margulisbacteria bacterium]|nr:aminoacyl-tRNA hydrolase [Candidatus Margulisiibacteriota bacterium]